MSAIIRKGNMLAGIGEHLQGVMQQTNRTSTVQAHLLGLPLELVLEIVKRLPPASAKLLSYACQQFYYWSSAWLSRLDFYKADHFEMLCILERAHQIRAFACRGCLTLHSKKMFLPEELKQPAIVRCCIASMPIFSICSRSTVRFRDLQAMNQTLRKLPQYTRFGWASGPECCHNGHKINGMYNDQQLVVSSDKEGIALLSFVNIWQGAVDDAPDKRMIQKRLNGSNIRICPHMLLNDTRIADIYDQNGVAERGNYDGQAATRGLFLNTKDDEVVRCEHEHCDTFAQWYYTENYSYGSEGGWIQILGFRYLGDLRDPLDPKWLIHTPLAGTTIPQENCVTN